MVVGQFGSYISEMFDSIDEPVRPGDVILTSDPFKCGGSISHINDWLVCLPIFWGDELGLGEHVRPSDGRGGPTGRTADRREDDLRRGRPHPAGEDLPRGRAQQDVLDVILNNVRMPEMNRADLMGIIAGCRTARSGY